MQLIGLKMNNNIKIKLNKSNIKKIEKKGVKSLEELAKNIVKDAPIPSSSGELKNDVSITTKKNTVTILHNEIYSMRQYFHPEYNHKTGKSEWYKDYLTGAKKQFMISIFADNFKVR